MKLRVCTSLVFLCFTFHTSASNWTYRLVKVTQEVDAEATGNFILSYVLNYFYQGDKLSGSLAEQDLTGDGIADHRSSTTNIYDTAGRRFLLLSESSSLPDGAVQSRGETTYVYGSNGRVVETVSTSTAGTETRIQHSTFEYDTRDRLVLTTSDSDANGDGTWDSRTTFLRIYDGGDHLVAQIRESDSFVDGTIDYRLSTTNILDPNGRIEISITTIDYEADGLIDGTERTTYTYGRQDRRASALLESFDADNALQATVTDTLGYDRNGNLSSRIQSIDANMDGFVDQIVSTSYFYERVKAQGKKSDSKNTEPSVENVEEG